MTRLSSYFSLIKLKVSEQWCWYFFLVILFVPTFTDYEKLVINLYRVWICIPVLICIRWKDFNPFMKNRFVQLFLLLTAWFTLSLTWSDSDTIHNMAAKMLATLALLFLIFNISRYQFERFKKLDYYYILAALLLLSAVYYKWGVIDTSLPGIIFGVFENRNPIAWFSASAAIISFFHVVHARNRLHLILFSISFLLLTSATLSLSSRGALLGLLTGTMIVVFSKAPSLKSFFVYLSIILIALLTTIVTIELYYSDYFSGLIERADSHRFEIYVNAITRITESPSTFFFGHGIAASPRNMIGESVINNWHSIYINATFYGGIIALFLLLSCLLKRPYEIIIKKSKISSWDAVVLGMMVTLQFDGHRIYEYPGGLLFVLTIPMFIANILASENSKS